MTQVNEACAEETDNDCKSISIDRGDPGVVVMHLRSLG
jgi:hypothetical protein